MSLGSNYQRNDSKENKRIALNLKKHDALMNKYIAEGMNKEDASAKALKEMRKG